MKYIVCLQNSSRISQCMFDSYVRRSTIRKECITALENKHGVYAYNIYRFGFLKEFYDEQSAHSLAALDRDILGVREIEWDDKNGTYFDYLVKDGKLVCPEYTLLLTYIENYGELMNFCSATFHESASEWNCVPCETADGTQYLWHNILTLDRHEYYQFHQKCKALGMEFRAEKGRYAASGYTVYMHYSEEPVRKDYKRLVEKYGAPIKG